MADTSPTATAEGEVKHGEGRPAAAPHASHGAATASSVSHETLESNAVAQMRRAGLEVRHMKNSGRGVFARHDMKAGDVVCANAPVAAVLLPTHVHDRCSQCFQLPRSGKGLSKCAKCKRARYCAFVR